MASFINIMGHQIEVADEEELGLPRDPVPVNFTGTDQAEVAIPAFEDKASLVRIIMGGTKLPQADYLMLQPSLKRRRGRRLGFAELRPIRIPQYDTSDHMHQFQLFNAVGQVTVASGHVEMAMKKVLVSLRGGEADLMSRDLPTVWADLVKELRKFCDDSTELVSKLKTLLDEAEENKLNDQRNDVVHGYWWMVSAHEHLVNARYYRPRDQIDPAMIFNRPADLQNFSQQLFTLANELERLVVPDWPLAMFASDPNKPVPQRFRIHEDVPPGNPLIYGEAMPDAEEAEPEK